MKWTLKIGTLFGIGLYLHLTFILLSAVLGSVTWLSTGQLGSALTGVLFVVAVFFCGSLLMLGLLAQNGFGSGQEISLFGDSVPIVMGNLVIGLLTTDHINELIRVNSVLVRRNEKMISDYRSASSHLNEGFQDQLLKT